MAKNFEIDGQRWIQTPINMALEYADLFHYRICILLNVSKHVIIDYDPNDTRKKLKNLQDKSVEYIYLLESDLLSFMQDVKTTLEQVKLESGELSFEDIMTETTSISTCFEFMKSAFLQLGFSSESLVLAEQINRRTMKVVRDTPNLVELLRRLRNDLHPHFMRALLTGSLSACLVESFSWGNDEIKEKLSMGAILCQLNWEQRHYDIYDHGENFSELKKLPIEMGDKLREAKTFSREVIEIVEQSFERQDGSGFPRGLTASSIGRLPAIHLVSASFIRELIRNDFDYSKRGHIVGSLKVHYSDGPFKQVMETVSRKLAA